MLFKRKVQPAEVPIMAQLCSLERELFEARTAAQSEIASRQASTAKELTARLLAGEDMSEIFEDDRELKEQITRIDLAYVSCRASRLAAITDSLKADSVKLRAAAADKNREADKIDKQTAPLLQKLAEIENVPYTKEILLAARAGVWSEYSLATGRTKDRCAPFDLLGDVSSGHHVPRSETLRREADALLERAERAEERQPANHGYVEGETLGQLVDQLFARPEVLGPPAHDVVEWVNAALGKPLEPVLLGSHVQGTLEVINDSSRLITSMRLAWKGFTIDEANSYVRRYLKREAA